MPFDCAQGTIPIGRIFLRNLLREQILPLEATLSVGTWYGQKYSIIGSLTGPNGNGIQSNLSDRSRIPHI